MGINNGSHYDRIVKGIHPIIKYYVIFSTIRYRKSVTGIELLIVFIASLSLTTLGFFLGC